MRTSLKQLSEAMWRIVLDPRSSRIERIECAKVILSCHGCFLPDLNESFLTAKQVVQLRGLKQEIVERTLRRKERRKRQNRRAYLRRQIKALEAQQGGQNA
jgi:hypothetical protein